MRPKKRARRSSFDLDSLASHLECPVCLAVPRDGVMLQCKNGHNVCAACKARLDRDAKCPIGRCDFNVPPTRNRTVNDLIQSYSFEFPCKYQQARRTASAASSSASVCEFVGTKMRLERHEEACKHRPVPCQRNMCGELVPANSLVEHYETAHGTSVCLSQRRHVFHVSCCLMQHALAAGNAGWGEKPFYTPSAGHVFPCAELRGGQMYLWLVMLAPKRETDRFECSITLGEGDLAMSFPAPVYPVDWTRQEILEDEDCVRVGVESVRKMLVEDGAEGDGTEKEFLLKTKFRIVKKTD